MPKTPQHPAVFEFQTVKGVRPEATLEYANPAYAHPQSADIKSALAAGRLTGAGAGQLLGVNSRTIRKWTGGEQSMPYSAWRLLLCTGDSRGQERCSTCDSHKSLDIHIVTFLFSIEPWIQSALNPFNLNLELGTKPS